MHWSKTYKSVRVSGDLWEPQVTHVGLSQRISRCPGSIWEHGLLRKCVPDDTSANQEQRARCTCGQASSSTCELSPQALPCSVRRAWQPTVLLKSSCSHFLARLLLSKSPSARPMICLILNGWFMTPSSRCIVEPCHLNFGTLVPARFTFCLPAALLRVLLRGDTFCSLGVRLL